MPSRQIGLVALLATASIAVAGAGFGQVPRLLKDLNTGGAGSGAFLQAELDGFVYLIASEPDHGDELWRTDGTAAGTTLVKDVWPGPTPSDSFYMVNAGGTIFFAPDTEEYGRELWKSDGTEAGTVLVRDILPGPKTAFPERFVAVGETLFFVARDEDSASELWTSDGTEAGTRMVKDISIGDGFGGANPLWLTASGDEVFFVANDGVHGRELWASDGTEAGTRLVKDILPGAGDSFQEEHFDWNGTLYFAAFDGEHGNELWQSDGTEAGTRLLKDIYPGERSSFPGGFAAVGDTLFFVAEDPVYGAELHRTDGTEEGTVRVADARPGIDGGQAYGITDVGGTAFFFVLFGTYWELWTSDGTEAGTRRVREIEPGRQGFVIEELLELDGELLFSGGDPDQGIELWRSDGTEAGTTPIKDIFPGEMGSSPRELTRLGSRILFAAEDGTHGRELWTTDGTEAGTILVRDINSKGTRDGRGGGLLELDGVLYFAAEDRESGRELWRSDGTAAGTFIVRDINPQGDGFASPNFFFSEIAVADRQLFFFVDDGVHGTELWTSDGTPSGTRLVRELVPGDDSEPGFHGLLLFLRGTEKFVYLNQLTEEECILWRSDGTAEGTVEVLRSPVCVVPVASLGELVFLAGDGLWRSDGTTEGTFAVADPGFFGPRGNLAGAEFVPLGDVLLFTVGAEEPERELWRTDGTRAGTYVVKDVVPGPASSYPEFLVEHDGRVFFRANDGVHGTELWQTDGTAAGTSMVVDLVRGPGSSAPRPLAGVGGTLFFAADISGSDGVARSGLWKTDGAGRETRLVRDEVRPSFEPAVAFGGQLYFTSGSFESGGELWRSNGSRSGTALVADLVPGSRGSGPSNFTVAGRNLFFTAASPRYGRELWVVGAGTATGVPGRLTSLADLDGLGGDEVAALLSNVVVRDAASGAEIVDTPLAPGAGWAAVDFEPVGDFNGNGSAELAVLARERNRNRVFVRDALTGELVSTLQLRRNRQPLDLEVIPASGPNPQALAVLTRGGLAGPSWVTVKSLAGAGDLDVPLIEDFGALDLEIAPRLERRGRPALVVLGQSGPDDRGRLLAVDSQGGGLIADWNLPDGLVPVDLEIVQQRPKAPGVAAVLVEKKSNGAARVLTLDLASGEMLRTTRFSKKYRALDLEPAPGRRGSAGPAISILQERRSNGKVRVSTRNAFSGRKLGRATFAGILLALDLATVRDFDGSGEFEAAVLGEAECAEAATAIVLRDSESGSRLGCYAVP